MAQCDFGLMLKIFPRLYLHPGFLMYIRPRGLSAIPHIMNPDVCTVGVFISPKINPILFGSVADNTYL